MFTKPVLTFCGLTFALSWGLFFSLLPLGFWESASTFAIGATLFMLGPAIAAVICARIFDKGHMLKTLAFKPIWNRWMVVAWAVPLLICLGALLLSLLGKDIHLVSLREGLLSSGALPAGTTLPPYIDVILVIQAISLGAAINGVLLISEELGWRGFLWSKLIAHGFWKTALFTGIVWGFWHAPLIYMGHNYPGLPIAGIFLMVGFTLLVSPIIGYVRLKNGSVWAASLFHGTLNAVAGLSVLALARTDAPLPLTWKGILGLGGVMALALACLWVYFSLRADQKSLQPPE
ncbi:MAG: CPBP family intramembrane metalloprotease [Robiginitomaculum sp.]|nr:MAG: CPBP family intramembrane metalloprotease [Robiginitomaculum sp.]